MKKMAFCPKCKMLVYYKFIAKHNRCAVCDTIVDDRLAVGALLRHFKRRNGNGK